MTSGRDRSVSRVAEDIARGVKSETLLGLGSGSTVASVLRQLLRILRARHVKPKVVPTSMQIEVAAESEGLETVQFRGRVDLVIDGADQVDGKLNLIKGGGGALLKEKILMSGSRRNLIVADEHKFVAKLGMNSVKVPIEVSPFAREVVKLKLTRMGGTPEERLLPKGYPYFTENGNIILDTGFKPIGNPKKLEAELDGIPGVVEAGIFTVKPLTAYKIMSDGNFEVLKASG